VWKEKALIAGAALHPGRWRGFLPKSSQVLTS
jgi:hypothetical protein